jgi:hypothetical protein
MSVRGIHFGRFFRSLRVARGWTIKKMAAAVEKTEPRIFEYERQPEPRMYESTYGAIARAMGMTPDALTQAWKTTPVVLPEENDRRPRQLTGDGPPTGRDAALRNVGVIEHLHAIPIYDLSSPASHWAEINGAEGRTDESGRNNRAVDQGLFRIRIHGDCMEPAYHDGDIVEFKIWRNDSSFPIGRNVVLTNSDGLSTFKKLDRIDSEGMVVLTALNRKKYPKEIRLPVQTMSRIAVAVGRFVPEEPAGAAQKGEDAASGRAKIRNSNPRNPKQLRMTKAE